MTFFFDSASYVLATCELTKLKYQRWPIHITPATTWIQRKMRFRISLTFGSIFASLLAPEPGSAVEGKGRAPQAACPVLLAAEPRQSPFFFRSVQAGDAALRRSSEDAELSSFCDQRLAVDGLPPRRGGTGQVVERGQCGESDRMHRWARRDGMGRVAAFFHEPCSAEGEAPFALADSRPETRIALQRFDISMAGGNGPIDLVKRDVFAATSERLQSSTPSYSQRASQVSKSVTRRRAGRTGFSLRQMKRDTTSLAGFSRPGTSLR